MAKKAKTAKAVKKDDGPTLPPVKLSWVKRTFNAVKGWILGNGIDLHLVYLLHEIGI